jgi:hypothetical protein
MVRYFLAFALHRVFRLSFSDGSHLFGLTQQDTAFACRVISGINMQSASIVFARFSVVCMACTSLSFHFLEKASRTITSRNYHRTHSGRKMRAYCPLCWLLCAFWARVIHCRHSVKFSSSSTGKVRAAWFNSATRAFPSRTLLAMANLSVVSPRFALWWSYPDHSSTE